MISPTAADIGRRVLYFSNRQPDETGVIHSFNPTHVFVVFGVASLDASVLRAPTPRATRREQLVWLASDTFAQRDDDGKEAPRARPAE